jgi:hypothetical protein
MKKMQQEGRRGTKDQKFVEYVATQMAGGHWCIDDLVQDTIADEDELHRAVSNNAD